MCPVTVEMRLLTAIMYSWAIRYSSTVSGSGILYSLTSMVAALSVSAGTGRRRAQSTARQQTPPGQWHSHYTHRHRHRHRYRHRYRHRNRHRNRQRERHTHTDTAPIRGTRRGSGQTGGPGRAPATDWRGGRRPGRAEPCRSAGSARDSLSAGPAATGTDTIRGTRRPPPAAGPESDVTAHQPTTAAPDCDCGDLTRPATATAVTSPDPLLRLR